MVDKRFVKNHEAQKERIKEIFNYKFQQFSRLEESRIPDAKPLTESVMPVEKPVQEKKVVYEDIDDLFSKMDNLFND